MGGVKNDSEKTPLDLIPPIALEALGQVLERGAKKYDRYNWTKGFDYSRLYGACLRHLNAWWGGESTDPETGLSHLWHALADIVFLVAHEHYKLGSDDRHSWPAGKAENDP